MSNRRFGMPETDFRVVTVYGVAAPLNYEEWQELCALAAQAGRTPEEWAGSVIRNALPGTRRRLLKRLRERR